MGLASLLLGNGNPFAAWADNNRNTLAAVGSGLMSGQNFSAGLSNAAQYLPQARAADYEMQRKLEADNKVEAQTKAGVLALRQRYPDLADAVETGAAPLSDAWNEAFKRMSQKTADTTDDITEYNFARQNGFTGTFPEWMAQNKSGGAGGSFETGYTPIWGENGGKPAIALPGNDGKLYINGAPADPAQFVPTNPYDLNAQKAGGNAFGKATGGAQFSMPQVENELAQSISSIQKLSEPDIAAGKDEWFNQAGALPRGMVVMNGSNMAKFRNTALNIIDRSWLSARAALKGGGQITDYEGAKAENAVSMMKAALDSGDKKSYEDAVVEYEYWIKQGFAKLQQQAGVIQGYGAEAQAPTAGGGSTTSTGVTWSVEP